MTVRCCLCGQEWPRDPALEVPCPTCLAKIGQACRRPSGYTGNFTGVHAARDQAAMQAGLLEPCPAAPKQQKKAPQPPASTKQVPLPT
ncbi:MAG: hypothetical protein JXA93_26265 [Anaerolineae bacterium]|nr:hypothetical protein [Anaerolineae bacterium]